jgi:hypothetical protein
MVHEISTSANRAVVKINGKNVQFAIWDMDDSNRQKVIQQLDFAICINGTFEDIEKQMRLNGYDCVLEDIYDDEVSEVESNDADNKGVTYRVEDTESGECVTYEGDSFEDAKGELLNSIEDGSEFDLLRNGERIWCGKTDTINDLDNLKEVNDKSTDNQYSVCYECPVETNEICKFGNIDAAIEYANNQVIGLEKYDYDDNTNSNNHGRWIIIDNNTRSEENPIGDIVFATEYYYNK